MSTRIWQGDATAVAQESRATPSNVEIADIFNLTINGKTVTYTATAATVANVTAGLTAAVNASTIPEFSEVTAVDRTTYVELNGVVAGVPFTVTASTVDGGGANTQDLIISTPTAATGPNYWDNAQNWSGATVPITGDDVIIDSGSVSILYGLAQSAVTLASLTISRRYTGKVGLAARNSKGYEEYRATYLAISATTLTVGSGSGQGSGRIKIDTGTNQTTVVVLATGAPIEVGLESFLWKGVHAANVVITSATMGVAGLGGDVATVATIRQTGGSVRCGSGVTLTTVDKSGGDLTLNSGLVTLNNGGGDVLVLAGAVTTLTILGGTVVWSSTGTVTNLSVSGKGRITYQADNRARTVTNASLYAGGCIIDPDKTVTWTNGIDLLQAGLAEVCLDLGKHLTLTPSAI